MTGLNTRNPEKVNLLNFSCSMYTVILWFFKVLQRFVTEHCEGSLTIQVYFEEL